MRKCDASEVTPDARLSFFVEYCQVPLCGKLVKLLSPSESADR